jgi:hypothetical protein
MLSREHNFGSPYIQFEPLSFSVESYQLSPLFPENFGSSGFLLKTRRLCYKRPYLVTDAAAKIS